MLDLFSGHFLETSLQGRIGWLGDIKTIKGKTFIKFNVACHIFKNVEWVSCLAYDSKARLIEQFAKVSTEVSIKGYQRTDSWFDKDTQEKKTKTNIIIKDIGFVANTKNAFVPKSDFNLDDFKTSDEENEKALHYAKEILKAEGYTIVQEV